jgi:hypothetical protein
MLPTDVVVPREPEEELKPGTAEEENKKGSRSVLQERNSITQSQAGHASIQTSSCW